MMTMTRDTPIHTHAYAHKKVTTRIFVKQVMRRRLCRLGNH